MLRLKIVQFWYCVHRKKNICPQIEHDYCEASFKLCGGDSILTSPQTQGADSHARPMIQVWSVRLVAVLVPIWMLFAHLDSGADTKDTAAVYSFGLMVTFGIVLLAFGRKTIPTGMVVIAIAFGAWLAWGLFGPWPVARQDIQVLAAAGSITGLGFFIGRQKKMLSFAWMALNWSLLIFALIAMFTFSSGDSGVTTSETINFDGRLSALFGSPNTAATLFGLAIILATGRLLLRLSNSKLNRLSRPDQIYYFAQAEYANFALLILAGVCLLLTVSRAGIFLGLASVIGLVTIELIRLSRVSAFGFARRKRFMIPMGLVFGTILALAITGEINPYDSEALLQNSSSRLILYETYFQIWLERPLFGHGLGSFNALNDSHTTLDNAAHLVTIGAAHNFVLQWLVQQGVIGFMVMAGVIGLILKAVMHPFRLSVSMPRIFLRVALAATILIFTHGLVDYALEIPSVMWTYSYILGLAAGFAASLSETPTHSADE